ncbi:unnamed protein product, partial [Urochloa humidicola]
PTHLRQSRSNFPRLQSFPCAAPAVGPLDLRCPFHRLEGKESGDCVEAPNDELRRMGPEAARRARPGGGAKDERRR